MFKINNHKISMVEKDFGILLPIKFETEAEETIRNEDNFKFNIFKDTNKELILSKTYTADNTNTIYFELLQSETSNLPVGNYKYDIDWYRDDVFLNNVIKNEDFVVVEKAGLFDEN